MALPTYAYCSVATVADALRITDPVALLAATTVLQRSINAAGQRINAHCNRVFLPTVLTRTLDVPGPGVMTAPMPSFGGSQAWGGLFSHDVIMQTPHALLPVPDLQTVSNLSVFGVVLTPSDYQILRYQLADGRPDTTYLLRVNAGIPVSWFYGAPSPWQPLDAISVLGTFAYDVAAVPDAVVGVAEELAVERYLWRLRQYGLGGANPSPTPPGQPPSLPDSGLTFDQEKQLQPYVADVASDYVL